MERVGADLNLVKAETAVIGTVGGDLEVKEITDDLSCGNVGGDCKVDASTRSEVAIGNVGGDVEANRASQAHIGSCGGHCEVRDVQGSVELGSLGLDATFN